MINGAKMLGEVKRGERSEEERRGEGAESREGRLTRAALGSSRALLLRWLVDLEGWRARFFWMQRLSWGLQRMLLLFGWSGMMLSSPVLSMATETQGRDGGGGAEKEDRQ